MNDFILFITSIIEYLGTTTTIILIIISFLLLLLLMYISIVAEHSSLLDILRYRKFTVIATSPSGDATTIKLRAWGRINAVERAAKRVGFNDDLTYLTFTVTELKK